MGRVQRSGTRVYGLDYKLITSPPAQGSTLTDDESYTVDPASNRLSQLTEAVGGPLNRGFGYLADGSLSQDDNAGTGTVLVYRYNQAGRMRSVEVQGGVDKTAYRYNGMGERVAKQDEGSGATGGPDDIRHFHYDQNGVLLAVSRGDGTLEEAYISLGQLPLARVTATGAIDTIHADHLATPQAMTDASGAVIWQRSQTPFGGTVSETGAGTNKRFPGQWFDAESGLHYNYFRDYDATTGRYVESDPLGLAAGVNTYAYVAGNPINRYDPFGLKLPEEAPPEIEAPPEPQPLPPSRVRLGLLSRIGALGLLLMLSGDTPQQEPGSALADKCPRNCPLCLLKDGTRIPPGTISARFDLPHSSRKSELTKESHIHLYMAHQNPKNCWCFWVSYGKQHAYPVPPSGGVIISIQPFINPP